MIVNSIKFKVSVLSSIILGTILIVYSFILYFSLYFTLYSDLDNELLKKANSICDTIQVYLEKLDNSQDSFYFVLERTICLKGKHPKQDKIADLEFQWVKKVDKLDLKVDYVAVLDEQGNKIMGSSNLTKDFLKLLRKKHSYFKKNKTKVSNVKFKGRSFRLIQKSLYINDQGTFEIQIATSLKPTIQLLNKRIQFILSSIPIILLLTFFTGKILSDRILKTVNDVTDTAKQISHKDLSKRVKIENVEIEIKYLVNSFNEMISRLEKSFKYVQDFSSQVAHELRTPLSIIQGEAEVSLRKERSKEEYRRVINIGIEEVDKMQRIIDDLFLLAQLDYRQEMIKKEVISFNEFFNEIILKTKVLAQRKNLEIIYTSFKENTYILANPVHLSRLFFNIIDNAIKFSPLNERLYINFRFKLNFILVEIIDSGPGIKKEHFSKIFDRFFHKDSPHDQHAGFGLGLSIASSIADFHQGKILAKNCSPHGSKFRIILPAYINLSQL